MKTKEQGVYDNFAKEIDWEQRRYETAQEISKCYSCGKTIEVPYLNDEQRNRLKPYCCTWSVFANQYLIVNGWHTRNRGITDNHPKFCPDCWDNTEPEFEKREYAENWVKQAESIIKNKEE